MPDPVTEQLTRLRGEASEESLEQATNLEREHERDLAKNGSDEAIRQRGYDPDDLRKAHRSQSQRSAGKGGSSSSRKKK